MIGKRILVLLGALVVPGDAAARAGRPAVGTADSDRDGRRRVALPPSARKDLVAIFGPAGAQVRSAHHARRAGRHQQERNPRGTHLAIYVEPIGEYTPQDYVDGTVAVTRVFLPSVFTRWKGLRSFDVCQEPRPVVDDREVAPARDPGVRHPAGSRLIDWSDVDVATLLATSDRRTPPAGTDGRAFSLYVAAHLKNTPAYQEAVGTAPRHRRRTPPTTHPYG